MNFTASNTFILLAHDSWLSYHHNRKDEAQPFLRPVGGMPYICDTRQRWLMMPLYEQRQENVSMASCGLWTTTAWLVFGLMAPYNYYILIESSGGLEFELRQVAGDETRRFNGVEIRPHIIIRICMNQSEESNLSAHAPFFHVEQS